VEEQTQEVEAEREEKISAEMARLTADQWQQSMDD